MIVNFSMEKCSDDIRRVIREKNLKVPLSVAQFKFVELKEAGVVVGNHYHTLQSGRIEIFIVKGANVIFRHREPGQKIEEMELAENDGVIIFPGTTHSFLATGAGMLIGLSNTIYDSAHDVTDKLF